MTVDAPSRARPPEGAHSGVHYRYPGSPPFRDSDLDRRLFRGRDHEADTVLHSILSSDVFLLYAQSGLGKSSLLNAGVVHELRNRDHWPVSLRLNDTTTSPTIEIRDQIRAAADADPDIELVLDRDVLGASTGDPSLWDLLASLEVWRGNDLQEPVLIFDQFEELFTLDWPDPVRDRFIAELGEVVRGHRRPGASTSGGLPAPRVRFVLVIREDSLGALEALSGEIPQIMKNRFRLGPLDPAQAESAIRDPAMIDDGRLDTRRFRYTEAAAAELLDFLRTRTVRGSGGIAGAIDPSQLQIVCQYVERAIVPRKSAGASSGDVVEIDAPDLGGRDGLDRILSEFYRRTVDSFPSSEQDRVRQLCEQGLINKDRRRLSLEQGEIVATYGVTVPMLTALVDHRLLRADPRVGSIYYELAHDTLVPAILADRDARIADRRRRRNRLLAIVAAVVGVLAIVGVAIVAASSGSEPAATDVVMETLPPTPPLPLGQLETETLDGTQPSSSFTLDALADRPVVVQVEPDAQLDVVVEVTDPSGATRRVDQLGNGGTEQLVIPPAGESDPAREVRVTASNAADAPFEILADGVDAAALVAGSELTAGIEGEGDAVVYAVDIDTADELIIEVAPVGGGAGADSGDGAAGDDKATLDVTIELLGPAGSEARPLVDAGGPGVPERVTVAGPGRSVLVVRGKSTTGEFDVATRDKNPVVAPGEVVAGAIDEVGAVSEFSFDRAGDDAYAVQVRPDAQFDAVLEIASGAGDPTVVDTGSQGVAETSLVVGEGEAIGIDVRGFESSLGSFEVELSDRPTTVTPGTPVTGEKLTVFDVAVEGGAASLLTVEPTEPDAQVDVQAYGPDGSLTVSTTVSGGQPSPVALGGEPGTHRLIVAPRPSAEGGSVPFEVSLTSEERYIAAFEDLLDDISELEARTEQYLDEKGQLDEALSGQGFGVELSTSDFQAALTEYQTRHRELQIAYGEDMRPLVAALDAKPLEESVFGDLETVRDAAVAHYRAWLDYVPEYQLVVENWTFDALRDPTTPSLLEFSRDRLAPFLDEIRTTFEDDLCSALRDEQPSSGQLQERIADECES